MEIYQREKNMEMAILHLMSENKYKIKAIVLVSLIMMWYAREYIYSSTVEHNFRMIHWPGGGGRNPGAYTAPAVLLSNIIVAANDLILQACINAKNDNRQARPVPASTHKKVRESWGRYDQYRSGNEQCATRHNRDQC
jgi:hypothetical protein